MTKRAVCVGVDRYADGNIPALAGCGRDARAVAAALTGRLGFFEADVKVLVDAQATRDGVLRAVDWLLLTAAPGDTLVLYLACYGTLMPDRQTGSELDEVLVVHDHDFSFNQLRDDDLAAKLQRVPAGAQAVCILDAGRRGPLPPAGPPRFGAPLEVQGRFLLPPAEHAALAPLRTRPWPLTSRLHLRRGDDPPYLTVAACGDQEVATETAAGGAFTQALLASLGGPGLPWGELARQAGERLRASGVPQHPVSVGTQEPATASSAHGPGGWSATSPAAPPGATGAPGAYGQGAPGAGAYQPGSLGAGSFGGQMAPAGGSSGGPGGGAIAAGLAAAGALAAGAFGALSGGSSGGAPAGGSPLGGPPTGGPPVGGLGGPPGQAGGSAGGLTVGSPGGALTAGGWSGGALVGASGPIDQELANFNPGDASVRVCQGLFSVLPFAPQLNQYRSVAEAIERLYPQADAAVRERALALAASPETAAALRGLSLVDTASTGLAALSALKGAFGLLRGQGSAALETDPQQGLDAAAKLLAIAHAVYRLFPGSPASRVQLFHLTPAGQHLSLYYGAVDVALPFADNLASGAGSVLGNLWQRHGSAAAGKLGSVVGAAGASEAQGVLGSLLAPLDGVVQRVAPFARQAAGAASQHLPNILGAADKMAGMAATTLDALPIYRYLGARLAAEACVLVASRGL